MLCCVLTLRGARSLRHHRLLVGNARLRTTEPSAAEPDYLYEEARHDFAHIVKVHKQHGWTSHPMFKNA